MIEQKNSASKTGRIAQLITTTGEIDESKLVIAKHCLIDYLASSLAAQQSLEVLNLRRIFEDNQQSTVIIGGKTSSPANAALVNGFTAHFSDLDDVQSNICGHPSVVIFSALLAVISNQASLRDLLSAYVVGLEVEGLLGAQFNPRHKMSGYHTTATLGVLGAAAAIARLKKFDVEQTVRILSFAADQSAGLGSEVGTDNKPLHAGISARNAVYAYEFCLAGLSTNQDIFNDKDGWNETVVGKDLDITRFENEWLNPGQIISPGMWFKQHPFCSAAMSGYDAAKAAYQSGIRFTEIEKIRINIKNGDDHALNFRHPQNGQQGKFSAEYIIWQTLKFGDVNEQSFDKEVATTQFLKDSSRFERKISLNDDSLSEHVTVLDLVLTNGKQQTFRVSNPLGSPQKQPTLADCYAKFVRYDKSEYGQTRVEALKKCLKQEKVSELMNFLREI
ncbi:MmgE/PrpD family protein [Fructilactobacillus vespulae]|uniref:MmgE/PrpD family protein n=1 Tax=Fructilactobacillus vespulae TaxID=1249630 RepID=UPI0039B50E67